MSQIEKVTNIESCGICVEDMKGNSAYKKIQCLYCNQSACRTCYETYIVDQTRAGCMYPSCSKDWSNKFLRDSFTNTFIDKRYKKHLEDVYFEREKGLLPATQQIVSSEIMAEEIAVERSKRAGLDSVIRAKYYKDVNEAKKKLIQKKVAELNKVPSKAKHWRWVENPHKSCWYDLEYTNRMTQIRSDFKDSLHEVHDKFIHDFRVIRARFNDGDEEEIGSNKRVKRERRFIRACSVEDCKGFLSSGWKCGLCATHVCYKCHMVLGEVVDEDHECDPDMVATAKMITSESKPCPGCHINIIKIDGCNQMWCTQCNTAWDWVSGKIQTKIHNPHYFEYLRTLESGVLERNPLEARCGREIDDMFVRAFVFIFRRHNVSSELSDYVFSLCRRITHIREVDLLAYAELGESPDTLALRVSYLRDKITEKEFKRRVQMANKRFHKMGEIRDIIAMFVQTVTDILFRYRDEVDRAETLEEVMSQTTLVELDGSETLEEVMSQATLDEIDRAETVKPVNTLDEIKHLETYASECLKVISDTYKSVHLTLTVSNHNIFGLVNNVRLQEVLEQNQKDDDLFAIRKILTNDCFIICRNVSGVYGSVTPCENKTVCNI